MQPVLSFSPYLQKEQHAILIDLRTLLDFPVLSSVLMERSSSRKSEETEE